jgi:hypothetical protein
MIDGQHCAPDRDGLQPQCDMYHYETKYVNQEQVSCLSIEHYAVRTLTPRREPQLVSERSFLCGRATLPEVAGLNRPGSGYSATTMTQELL